MKWKKWAFYSVVCLMVLGACAYHKYQRLPSQFMLDGFRFVVADNMLETEPVFPQEYKPLTNKKVGVITHQTLLYPKENQEGFKVPEGSVVYTMDQNSAYYIPEYAYTLIIQSPDNSFYRALLVINRENVANLGATEKRFEDLYWE